MTKEEFIEWKHSSTTKEMFAVIKEVRDTYQEKVVSGGTLNSLQETARVVGNIEAFDYLLNIDFEE